MTVREKITRAQTIAKPLRKLGKRNTVCEFVTKIVNQTLNQIPISRLVRTTFGSSRMLASDLKGP
jgi:hypothetical protein